jgi:streptogramin lyase
MTTTATSPFYILLDDDRTVVNVDPQAFHAWVVDRVAKKHSFRPRLAADTVGPYWISTVFTGVTTSLPPNPLELWETAVFKSGDDDSPKIVGRYATYAEAKAGHQGAVDLCRARIA